MISLKAGSAILQSQSAPDVVLLEKLTPGANTKTYRQNWNWLNNANFLFRFAERKSLSVIIDRKDEVTQEVFCS